MALLNQWPDSALISSDGLEGMAVLTPDDKEKEAI
jgi:hypothetical protein